MKCRGEAVFVAVLILFSAAALWQSYGIAGFSKWASPGVFPMLASATMLVCGLFIFRDHRKQNNTVIQPSKTVAPSANIDTVSDSQTQDTAPVLPIRVVVVTALLVLYVIAMPTLGFLISSGLFLLASISYLWKKPVWLAVLVSAISLVLIHVVFRMVFQVILPQGTLIGWLL